MRDLNSLSLKLQSRTCNIVTAFSEVDSTIDVLKAMKTAGGGKSTKKVLVISATNTFNRVLLAEKKPGINAGLFMAAVIDELS
jgi:prefoldin subunit 5